VNLTEGSILVTGGSGFLGRHVVDALRGRGCRSIVVPRRAEHDLTDGDAVRELYREVRPRIVIHLAAVVGGIGANQRDPARFLHDNLRMGLHCVHEAWRAGVEKFVAVGTVCSYPADAPVPFREDALWDGYPEPTNAPYGIAKRALLALCQAYREQYGFPAIFLVPANLYGPGDSFDESRSHVIPALVRKLVEARESGAAEIVAWGDGSATREFLHVRDAAEGVVAAAERYDGHLPVNLGTGSDIAIRDLVERLRVLCRFEGAVAWDASRPNGQKRRRLDVSRARELFGFEAAIPLDEGLAEVVAAYEESRSGRVP